MFLTIDVLEVDVLVVDVLELDVFGARRKSSLTNPKYVLSPQTLFVSGMK